MLTTNRYGVWIVPSGSPVIVCNNFCNNYISVISFKIVRLTLARFVFSAWPVVNVISQGISVNATLWKNVNKFNATRAKICGMALETFES